MMERQEKLKREEALKAVEGRKQQLQSSRKTERIIEANKRERIQEIYEMLKPQSSNESIEEVVISAQHIDLHSLPTDILEVFSPLLCEMEELGTTLNQQEFLDASLRLYQTLNI
jgi:hypothetical protein